MYFDLATVYPDLEDSDEDDVSRPNRPKNGADDMWSPQCEWRVAVVVLRNH